MSTIPVSISVRCDAFDALSQTIEALQAKNAALSVDDCIDIIFSVGLIAVSTTTTLVAP